MQITIREPSSAFTHFIAMMLALFASAPLLVKTALGSNGREFTAMCVLFSYTQQVPLIIV